jgi:glutathione reductase (NADPH)
MKDYDYDVVVIGSGPAGQGVIHECEGSGLRVALAESRELGGTCPLRGCDPKKVLAGAAEVISRARGMEGKGIRSRIEMNWADLTAFKRTFTDPIPEEMERRLQKAAVEIHHGEARFTGLNELAVGGKTVKGKHIVVATGAAPRKLGIPGEEHVTLSDRFLEMDGIPESVLFIGGGYISFEFAHMAARAGCRATILQRGARVLKRFDPDLVRLLVRASENAGVEVRLNTPVRAVEKKRGGYRVFAGKNGGEEFAAGLVVHGGGRAPNIQNLGLQKADVLASAEGVFVNDTLRSFSNPQVYAAGDAAATPFFLTPTANLEGRLVGRNILSGNQEKPDYRAVPSVVFTVPPLASVGISEEELIRRGADYRKKFAETSSWFESRRIGMENSGIKLLLEEGSGRILGAHLLGNHAEEVINIFALAIRLDLTLEDLLKIPWVYPSSLSEIGYLQD